MALPSSLSPAATSKTATPSPPFPSPNFPSFPSAKRASLQLPRSVKRRGTWCPPLHVAALHTTSPCLDTQTGSRRATLYQVLEIPHSATEAEIKASYRRLARLHHPDVVAMEDKATCTKLFLQIHAAYTALSDAHSRARYDLQLSMQALQAAGCRRTTVSQAHDCSRSSQQSSSSRSPLSVGSRKGRSWETDQCWC